MVLILCDNRYRITLTDPHQMGCNGNFIYIAHSITSKLNVLYKHKAQTTLISECKRVKEETSTQLANTPQPNTHTHRPERRGKF